MHLFSAMFLLVMLAGMPSEVRTPACIEKAPRKSYRGVDPLGAYYLRKYKVGAKTFKNIYIVALYLAWCIIKLPRPYCTVAVSIHLEEST